MTGIKYKSTFNEIRVTYNVWMTTESCKHLNSLRSPDPSPFPYLALIFYGCKIMVEIWTPSSLDHNLVYKLYLE
jgi:hypothetical protein